tara:strand:+ start:275 stop:1585 length:1311 start_codon:yes stop_codon:yes gene_type:complete
MPVELNSSDATFEQDFTRLLHAKRETDEDVRETVRGVLADIRKRGDAALFDYTKKFDRVELTPDSMRVSQDEIDVAIASVTPEILAALELARDRIIAYHERQRPTGFEVTDDAGVRLGSRWTPVGAVGLYVPGGTACYPSSVLMNALPARVAGVPRIAMVVPAPDGVLNPLVLAAARIAGVEEIYRIGGAQAIGALAFGTESIPAVDKIVGPGNAWVAEAKRQVFGTVGIDMVAGPSEILVIADGENDPAWLAADLLSQAEHDTAAQSILITDSQDCAEAVKAEVERQLGTLGREAIARESWESHGAIILVDNLRHAVPLTDRIAPEHLELAVDSERAEELCDAIRNAGSIFVGRHTPEAIGDYVGGPNHVLPTARSARFSSGLGVLDFFKRTSILSCSPESLQKLAPAAIALADAEGLTAHARSVSIRLNRSGGS